MGEKTVVNRIQVLAALLDETARRLSLFGHPDIDFGDAASQWNEWRVSQLLATVWASPLESLRGIIDRNPGAPQRALPEDLDREVAKRYGIGRVYVSWITNRRVWKTCD